MPPKKRKATQANINIAVLPSPAVERGRGRPPKQSRPTERASADNTGPVKKGLERPVKQIAQTAAGARTRRASAGNAELPRALRSASGGKLNQPATKVMKSTKRKKIAKSTNAVRAAKAATLEAANQIDQPVASFERRDSNVSVQIPTNHAPNDNEDDEDDEDDQDGISYWLMKAEPDSRIEKGKDVKFSIDDLKAAEKSEGWDGVRNIAARNNMRAMKLGDLAFFYHSNCKVPGIVGIMEIVQEHSIDESAFDTQHPYYDLKSSRDKPKWDLVHVQFRQKFPEIIKLKELQKFAKNGGVLENLQTLRQSRLSVSKVSKKQWDFIMSLVEFDNVGTEVPVK